VSDTAETLRRADGIATERELVRAMVDALPACWKCLAPATKSSSQRPSMFCDEHTPRRYEATGGTSVSWSDIPYAPALRALLERMRSWPEPATVAANDGGPAR
jgi:hypothetical protein